MLLGEQAIQVALGVGPGLYLGRRLGVLTLSTIRPRPDPHPPPLAPSAHVGAACVVLLAALVSALVVRRRADQLDLVRVLKARD